MANGATGLGLVNIESASAIEKSELNTRRAKSDSLCLENIASGECFISGEGGDCATGDTRRDKAADGVNSGG